MTMGLFIFMFFSYLHLKTIKGLVLSMAVVIPWFIILRYIILGFKSMDFKCPKCHKHYDVRSRPKFCPHCGAKLEK